MTGNFENLLAFFLYFIALFGIVIWSASKVKSSTDFIIGNRSLNFWLTGMAAHASDMSSWLLMGYPGLIFVGGLTNAWVAVGLVACMMLNWQFIAKRFRLRTEEWNCSTFSSFLQKRYNDNSGLLQLFSALFCFLFYIIYICAGLTGLGLLGQTLFGLSYSASIFIGLSIIVSYVIFGGFITLAWVDLVQGIFLLAVLCFVPIYILMQLGGIDIFLSKLDAESKMFLPQTSEGIIGVITMFFGWGLGYFGQPHIITKFIGIKDPDEIPKSRNFGMIWMIVTLFAATMVGLVGIRFFESGLNDPQMIFIEMVKTTFHPFVVGLILCAIFAATINVMSSQLLVLSSIMTEDLYRPLLKKDLSQKHLLRVSRLGVILAACLAFFIAYMQIGSIYSLVHYAWSGLGASFGPLIIAALYFKQINRFGALAAICFGGITAAVWGPINELLPIKIDALIPGFILSFMGMFTISYITNRYLNINSELSTRVLD